MDGGAEKTRSRKLHACNALRERKNRKRWQEKRAFANGTKEGIKLILRGNPTPTCTERPGRRLGPQLRVDDEAKEQLDPE